KPVADSVGVNSSELLAVSFPVVTETSPATAPSGTVAVTCWSDTTVNEARRLPNITLDAPAKCAPVIVTELPVIPDTGEIESIDDAPGTNTSAAPVPPESPPPPTNAVPPSPDSATLCPKALVPAIFDPCCDQVDPERVN